MLTRCTVRNPEQPFNTVSFLHRSVPDAPNESSPILQKHGIARDRPLAMHGRRHLPHALEPSQQLASVVDLRSGS